MSSEVVSDSPQRVTSATRQFRTKNSFKIRRSSDLQAQQRVKRSTTGPIARDFSSSVNEPEIVVGEPFALPEQRPVQGPDLQRRHRHCVNMPQK